MSQASDTLRREFKKNDDIRDAGLTTPEDVRRFDDIRYGTDADCQLLDVYRPKEKQLEEALPVIISIHGGGWVYGDKELYQYYCMSLAQRNFAVVNFTYRLAPEYKFPSCQEDTNLVVSWVLSHAQEYGFDTEHIFMVGDSAGAHALGLYAGICTNPEYAALYPFTVPQVRPSHSELSWANRPAVERNEGAFPQIFRPTAIALNCGAYWMDEEAGMDSQTMELMNDLFADGATKENLEKICVPKTITENYVPTYFMTCTGDFLQSQAALLYSRLMECQVPCEFQFYGDKDHELGHVFHLNMRSEIAAKCNDAQCEFFRKFM